MKTLKWCVLVGARWATVWSLPGLARYLKMCSM
jgi:hypothetical protein